MQAVQFIVLALVGWMAATQLTAVVTIHLTPGLLPAMAKTTGGSETLSLFAVGAGLLIAPITFAALLRGWATRRARLRQTLVMERDAELDAALTAMASEFELARLRRLRAHVQHAWDTEAWIEGSDLFLRDDIARDLTVAHGADHDYATFVVLHEYAHRRSGDATLFHVRDLLAVLTALFIAIPIALQAARVGDVSFTGQIVLLALLGSVALVMLLREVSRQSEAAADRWALGEMELRRGKDAAANVITRLNTLAEVPERRLAIAWRHHPAQRRRAVDLVQPQLWPLALLWGAALAMIALAASPIAEPSCNDCATALIPGTTLIVGVALLLLTAAIAAVWWRLPVRRGWRLLAVLLAAGLFALARLWTERVLVEAALGHSMYAGIIHWLYFAPQSGVIAVSLHLLVAIVIALVIRSASSSYDPPALRGSVSQRLTLMDVVAELRVAFELGWWGLIIILFWMGVLIALLPALRAAVDPLFLPALISFVVPLAAMGAAVASWLTRRPSRWSVLADALAMLLLASLAVTLAYLHRLQLAFMAAKRIDPGNPTAQVEVGRRMALNPGSFFTPELMAAARPGLIGDCMLYGILALLILALRVWTDRSQRAEREV